MNKCCRFLGRRTIYNTPPPSLSMHSFISTVSRVILLSNLSKLARNIQPNIRRNPCRHTSRNLALFHPIHKQIRPPSTRTPLRAFPGNAVHIVATHIGPSVLPVVRPASVSFVLDPIAMEDVASEVPLPSGAVAVIVLPLSLVGGDGTTVIVGFGGRGIEGAVAVTKAVGSGDFTVVEGTVRVAEDAVASLSRCWLVGVDLSSSVEFGYQRRTAGTDAVLLGKRHPCDSRRWSASLPFGFNVVLEGTGRVVGSLLGGFGCGNGKEE